MTAPNSTTDSDPTGLRAAKKEQAAARRTAKKAPAKKAPAKKTVTTATVSAAKIAWKRSGEPDAKGQAEGTGTCGDREYCITGGGDAWKATFKVGNKTTVLAENVSGKTAWQKCVAHNKSAA